MAYHDENGRITIDEQAANKDIKRLMESAQVLRTSRDAIVSLQRQAADMEGQISLAVIVKSQEMEKKLSQMIDKLEYTADYIRKTVRRYEILDEQIKQAIQSASNMASAVIAASGVSTNVGKSVTPKPSSNASKPSTSSSGNNKKNPVKETASAFEEFGDKMKDAFDSWF